MSEAMEIIGERRSVNSVSRKAFTDSFTIMKELESIDKEPNWTEATVISNKYNISFHRVLLLAAAMFHAGWAPAKMTRRIIEKLKYPEMHKDIV